MLVLASVAGHRTGAQADNSQIHLIGGRILAVVDQHHVAHGAGVMIVSDRLIAATFGADELHTVQRGAVDEPAIHEITFLDRVGTGIPIVDLVLLLDLQHTEEAALLVDHSVVENAAKNAGQQDRTHSHSKTQRTLDEDVTQYDRYAID